MERVEVAPLVISDIGKRIEKGAAEYGEPLTTHNGRDALVDAYEEALDLSLYLRQQIAERAAASPTLPGKGPITIVSAAVRDSTGMIYSLPAPARHHHIVQNLRPLIAFRESPEQGFLTSNGEFASRAVAKQIAIAAGQAMAAVAGGYSGPELFSEDLW